MACRLLGAKLLSEPDSAGVLSIIRLGTNFSEIAAFSSKKINLKIASVKWRPFCLGLNYKYRYDTVKTARFNTHDDTELTWSFQTIYLYNLSW